MNSTPDEPDSPVPGKPGTVVRIRGYVDGVVERARATVLLSIVLDLGRAQVTDRAMTLAGQAFTSILPVMILMTTMPGHGVVERAMNRISTQWLELDPNVPLTNEPSTASFGVFGILMTVIGATSFARALDRMYADIWEVRKLGMAGWWRWPIVILAIVIGITAEVFLIRGTALATIVVVAEIIVSSLVWGCLWAFIARLLTAGKVPALGIVATGASVGLTSGLFFFGTQVVFGEILHTAEVRFGVLGVVFSVITWLFVYAWGMVAATVVVHTLLHHARIKGRFGVPPMSAPADSES